MIYITGDTHRDFLGIEKFCCKAKTTKEDIIIILGDSGINLLLGSLDNRVKKEIEELPITFLCIHGNHEQRASEIAVYDEVMWQSGIVYREKEYPSINFAKDGEVYCLDGMKAIAIGGAYSVDKDYRLTWDLPWFDNEQPDEKIKKTVEDKLEKMGWKIDIVLSHTVPLRYEPIEVFLPFIDQSNVDKSTEKWLDEIEEKLEYKKWYAAHYHTEKKIDKVEIMYRGIEKLSGDMQNE